jgi:hypothetical protein
MPNLMFWNTRRLGASSDAERAHYITNMQGWHNIHATLLCELTTACQNPPVFNPTYRHPNSSQLCFGGYIGQNPIPIASYTRTAPTVSAPAVPPGAPGYRNAFTIGPYDIGNLVDRGLTEVVAFPGGARIFLLHAPAATDPAEKAVTFCAAHILANVGANPWVLIGDFNVEPGPLLGCLNAANLFPAAGAVAPAIGLVAGIRMVHSNQKTFCPLFGQDKEYDYAITNIANLTVSRYQASLRVSGSDHHPIIASW